jgi:hypothetical protein
MGQFPGIDILLENLPHLLPKEKQVADIADAHVTGELTQHRGGETDGK